MSRTLHLEWIVEPEVKTLVTSTAHVWTTKDGLYQVMRITSSDRDLPTFGAQRKIRKAWDIFEHDHKMGPGYPHYYKDLESALESVERFLGKTQEVVSNREEVVAHARSLDLGGSSRKRHETYKETHVPKEPITKRRSRSGNGMSCLDAAFTVLQEEGRPLTTKEMVELMEKKGYWSSPGGMTPWATVGASIGQEIINKKGQSRFTKVGRGLFACT